MQRIVIGNCVAFQYERKEEITMYRYRSSVLLLSGLFCMLTAGGTALANANGNWPQFRGPGARGIAKGDALPDQWSATENVAWKTDIPGRG